MPGALAANVIAFTRTLRAAGLPVGPGKALRALEAAAAVGLSNRRDFYWALHATLIDRHDQHEVFDQAFHVFWRNPDLLKRAMGLMLPTMRTELMKDDPGLSRRLQDALGQAPERPDTEREEEERQEIEIDGRLVFSDEEILRGKDFEQMTAEELAQARRLIQDMRLARMAVPTRRFRPAATGPRIDMRRSLRTTVRQGGDVIALARTRRRERPPPIVVLCDISGSMGQYARILLRFLYALTNDRDRVHTFLFGTRLTNVTRTLKRRDVDEALDRVGREVPDWDGGTRIGHCLDTFNRVWSRRVLGQGAIVLLISDGLDRDAGEGLAAPMERLRKSCRRLIWLNPLLRWEGYAPKAKGAAAMIDAVDEFRPVHNLDSLDALAHALGASGTGARR